MVIKLHELFIILKILIYYFKNIIQHYETIISKINFRNILHKNNW